MVIVTAATREVYKFPTKLNLKWKPRNLPYIQFVINFRTIGKTDNKTFLSKVCFREGKSFYDISLRMNWHIQTNSIMELQRIILSSKNIPSENL